MFGSKEGKTGEELPDETENQESIGTDIDAQISEIEQIAAKAAAAVKSDQSDDIDTDKSVKDDKNTAIDLDRTQYDEDYLVAGMLLNWSESLADMFNRPLWAMKQREAIRMGESLAAVLAKYAPRLRVSPEAKLANDVAAYVVPRLSPPIDPEQQPESSNEKETHGDQGKSEPTE